MRAFPTPTRARLPRIGLAALLAVLPSCGGGGETSSRSQQTVTLPITVTINGPTAPINVESSVTLTATVANSSNIAVSWTVVESGGGTISPAGVYTAPAIPGTFTVRASSQANPIASATLAIRVVIPVTHIQGYDVGVDYHATGADFLQSAFITQYHQPAVRQLVRAQLQGMADRGATVISTRIWFVTEPGNTDFGEVWRATFPMSDQEAANLRTYAQDVAAIQGSGGNRLRLDVGLLWLGAADYTMGSLSTGLGFFQLTPAEFTRRVELTTDKVLTAVTGVNRQDGTPVVDTIYLEGEVMIGAKANQDWFLTTHYPRFVSRVGAAGFQPSVYFIVAGQQDQVLDDNYVDVDYPALNNHRSMFWVYRSTRFMADNGLPLPSRIDFSTYLTSTGASYSDMLLRVLDDADATLPPLGAPTSYGAAETYYSSDVGDRRQLGLAFAMEAADRHRLHRVCFWTTPDGGGPGVHVGYPFAIEDFFLAP